MRHRLRKLSGRLLRSVADRAGYLLVKRAIMPYGISCFCDIQRLLAGKGDCVKVFFDVGANIGQTAHKARAAFPTAHIFCFEPHPETFKRLELGLKKLGPGVLGFPFAFGELKGDAAFFEYEEAQGGSVINSFVEHHRYPVRNGYKARQTSAPMITIDEFCADRQLEKIDVLKIDAEGYELNILRGATDMLATGKIRCIYIEYSDLLPSDDATSLIEIGTFLKPFEFHLVATYTDYVLPESPFYVSANALFFA